MDLLQLEKICNDILILNCDNTQTALLAWILAWDVMLKVKIIIVFVFCAIPLVRRKHKSL